MALLNRDLKLHDIPFILNYWASLTDEDIQRMFIDTSKLPKSEDMRERLTKLVDIPPSERQADPLIWEVDGKTIGLTNLNNIVRGEEAYIHLHIFNSENRGKGYGRRLFIQSVQKYLDRHHLKKVICEPASTNPYPTGLMRALGIPVARKVVKTPSVICVEHEVNCYEIDKKLADRISNRSLKQ